MMSGSVAAAIIAAASPRLEPPVATAAPASPSRSPPRAESRRAEPAVEVAVSELREAGAADEWWLAQQEVFFQQAAELRASLEVHLLDDYIRELAAASAASSSSKPVAGASARAESASLPESHS